MLMWDHITGYFRSKVNSDSNQSARVENNSDIDSSDKPNKIRKIFSVLAKKLSLKDKGLEAFQKIGEILNDGEDYSILPEELIKDIKSNYSSFASMVVTSHLPGYLKIKYLKSPIIGFIINKDPSKEDFATDTNAAVSIDLQDLSESHGQYFDLAEDTLCKFGISLLVKELICLNESEDSFPYFSNTIFNYLEKRQGQREIIRSIIDSPEFVDKNGNREWNKLNKALFSYMSGLRYKDQYTDRGELGELRERVYDDFITGEAKLENLKYGYLFSPLLFDVIDEILQRNSNEELKLDKLCEIYEFYNNNSKRIPEFTSLGAGFSKSTFEATG